MKNNRIMVAVLVVSFLAVALNYTRINAANLSEVQEVWSITNDFDIQHCEQGDEIILQVKVHCSDKEAVQHISVFSGILEYDNSLFEIEKVDFFPLDNAKVLSKSFDTSTCEFQVKYASETLLYNDSLLVELKLHVKNNSSTGKTTVCITHMDWSSLEYGTKQKVDNFIPAEVVIESAKLPGDVNGDHKINLSDVRIILQFCNRARELSSSQQKLADVNSDGVVNLLDAKLIMRYCNGE